MNEKYLTVTAVTKYIKRKFDSDAHLKQIWLRGEISNFKHHSRGHMYLTIKDEQSRIQAVMFAGNNRSLKFRPDNGMNVLIKGDVSVFEPYGQYQLYIQQMEPDGIGALYLAFEQLKEKLHKLGLFDEHHKKQLPQFPKHIGVITSPTGAAVRDIITTIKRRYPIVKATILPALVQGPNATNSIADAIEKANELSLFDVLIIGRGGGSIEDLWGFNEELVAKAIFHSEIPIISAVGHETDITISDYVADLRAATPTGAAELAVPSIVELTDRLSAMERSLSRFMNTYITNSRQMIRRLKQSYAFRYPEQLVTQKEQELDKYVERLEKMLNVIVTNDKQSSINLQKRLTAQHPRQMSEQAKSELERLMKQQHFYMDKFIEKKSTQLATLMEKLSLLNPLEIMKRGYAIPYTNKGAIVHSTKQVNQEDLITVTLADGELNCRVLSIEGEKNE